MVDEDYLYEMKADMVREDSNELLKLMFTEFLQECIFATEINMPYYKLNTPELLRAIIDEATIRLEQIECKTSFDFSKPRSHY